MHENLLSSTEVQVFPALRLSDYFGNKIKRIKRSIINQAS